MTKLLRADFSRLFRYKPFLIMLGLTAALSAYFNYGNTVTLNESYAFRISPFELLIYCSFVVTTFIAFFSGINFTEGIVRNKLFSGYSKAEIYFSNAIVSVVVSSVFTALYMTCGVFLVIKNIMSLPTFLIYVFVSVTASIAFSAVGTFAAFVFRGKAVPIVVCAVLIAGMFIATEELSGRLGAPEYIQRIDTVNGVPVDDVEYIREDDEITYKNEKNPRYISNETERRILETAYRLMPTSENEDVASSYYDSNGSEYLWQYEYFRDPYEVKSPKDVLKNGNVIYALAFTAIFTCAGVIIFKKENLK